VNAEESKTLSEEECAALLAVCDDLLARGEDPALPAADHLAPEEIGRLLRGVACLRRLERLWPRHPARPAPPACCPLCGSEFREPFSPTAGGSAAIPGYEILEELGRGGMGVVYKARQVGLNRLVALKRIQAGAEGRPETLARFRVEAEAAGRMQHPHIVQVYEVGDSGGRPFFSLELVEGGSLAQKLAGRPQPAGEAARLVETLARAVHHAHQHGIVHRDLKPANVLLAPDGTPKISDFGLAKRLEDDNSQTATGTVLGTPAYMSPEQARGQGRAVGPATDVYALGTILYEMLAGRPPFQGESAVDVLRQVLHDEPLPPHRYRAGLPRDLEIVCLKCLDKEPARRYATALDLADDLHRFLQGEPFRARPAGSLERLWRWSRRNPVLAALVGVVQLLLATLAVGAALTAWHFARERDWAVAEERSTQLANERLRDSYLAQARAERTGGEVGRRFTALDLLGKAAVLRPSLELRNEAIACLALPDLRPIRPWPAEGEAWNGFDAALQRCARVDSQGNFTLFRIDEGGEALRLPGPGQPGWVSQFSPDGRFFAARHHPPNGDASHFRLWDLGDRASIDRGPRSLQGRCWDFSPDGRLLAADLDDGRIVLYRLPSGALDKELARAPAAKTLAFHPGGGKLAVSCWEGPDVRICTVPDGQWVKRLLHPAPVRGLAWSDDGRPLATACGDGKVYVWDWRSSRPQMVLEGHKGAAVHVAFSHAGDLLASAGWDSMLRLWRLDTGRQLLALPGSGCQPRFRGDDRLLGWVDAQHQASVYDLVPAEECRILAGGPGDEFRTAAFRPDGRLLAAAGNRGVVLWDAVRGRVLARLPLAGTKAVLFEGNGEALLASGDAGVWRWPIRGADLPVCQLAAEGKVCPTADGDLLIGPPRSVKSGMAAGYLSQSAGGRVLAVNLRGGKAVVLRDGRDEIALGGQANRETIASSPDGRWVACSTWHGEGTRIWDAGSGALVQSLPGGDAQVAFSPDGRWLALGSQGEYRLWEAGSWQPTGRRWPRRSDLPPGCLAFRCDGRLLAIAPNNCHIRLVDPDTGAELATLTSPNSQPYAHLCFCGDGSRLAALSPPNSIHVWDLTRIRRQLAERNLHDAFPAPAATAPSLSGPGRLQVRLGPFSPWHRLDQAADLQKLLAELTARVQKEPSNSQGYERRGAVQARLGRIREAVEDYRKALALDPRSPLACNGLAWIYVTGPGELRQPKEALPLAERAFEQQPDNSDFLNTLGVVYYRLGRWACATETLQEAVAADVEGGTAFDLFFLAQCWKQRGEPARSRECYRQALAWRAAHPDLPPVLVEELDAFQAEAEAKGKDP
jgi:WD40 repeat protein/Tfp pilus assembly protein PilF/tRNA A-37 threonylcarbamoyl transferase component Bud32